MYMSRGRRFKVLTASACLEEFRNGNSKAFSAEHVFGNSSGTRIIDGSKISCWTKHANGKHSNQNLSDALNNSCNPDFYRYCAVARKGYYVRVSSQIRLRFRNRHRFCRRASRYISAEKRGYKRRSRAYRVWTDNRRNGVAALRGDGFCG